MDDDDVNSHHADDKEMSLRTPPILWFRQDRYFYFRYNQATKGHQ